MINDPPFRDYHNEIRAERDALRAEVERLTRDRDYWQNIRARPAERELAAAERKLAMAVEELKANRELFAIYEDMDAWDATNATLAALEKKDE